MTKNIAVKAYAAAVALVLVLVLVLFPFGKADGSTGAEPCVPKDAYTEVVVVTPAVPAVPATEGTPEIPGVPGVPAVVDVIHHEAVPEIWANWAPNNTQGPQNYVPIWPVDERGTWIIHEQGIPGGHEGPDGVYQQGGGNSPYFYRQAGVEAYDEEVVITPAIPAIPAVPAVPGTPGSPAVPAVTQEIFHPAVVCETPSETPTIVTETPVVPTPTPDDVQTPDVVEVPDKDETPVATPDKDKPVVTITENCVGDSLVTKTFKDGVAVSTSTVPNEDCADEVIRTTGEPTQEEGL